jgi:hypothetical protein
MSLGSICYSLATASAETACFPAPALLPEYGNRTFNLLQRLSCFAFLRRSGELILLLNISLNCYIVELRDGLIVFSP